MSVLCSLVR